MTKKIVNFVVLTLVTSLLQFSFTSPANAASCTKKELKALSALNTEMVLQYFTGDLSPVFSKISKAKKATTKKSLKSFLTKLENAIEENGGYSGNGNPANDVWLQLSTKIEYKRC